ncbi:NAD(P)-dependent malic enzyme, partial [Enterococcus faecalis]
IEDIHVVINGDGSAGLSITRKFLAGGVKHIIIVGRAGILSETDTALPPHNAEIAKITNRKHRTDDLVTVLEQADVFG